VKVRSLIAILALGLATAPAVHAAGWKQVTGPGGSNIDQVGLLRTTDGVLHLAWTKQTGPNSEDLMHTAISPQGAILATTTITGGWATLENPALAADPAGIRAFFGGIRTANAGEPNQELNTALSGDGGQSWALTIGTVAPHGAQAYGSPVAAATLGDGTSLEAWAGTLGTWVHAGLDPNAPNHDYQAPLGGCCGYDAGIAAAGAQAVLAWYSNASGHLGVFAQLVNPDGSPQGAAVNMPDTANMNVGMLGRTPIVTRPGGGFYIGYPTGYPSINRVRLWPVGAPKTALIAKTDKTSSTTESLAAAPDGRLWVVWKDTVAGKPRIFARRSNKAATEFGGTVDAGAPPGASSGYRLDASAVAQGLDVLGTFTIGTAPGVDTFHRRIAPGLTLRAKPSSLSGRRESVTFTVEDAGAPVSGAKIKAPGDVGVTNDKGKATLTIAPHGRRVTVRATLSGYDAAELKLRVSH
jgi:hypothetical protein